ncbi:mucin-binding protein [Limosilactobacillus difficilis]|uniref:mucin-binding protein n=1 Tax=Limosilactobacillus difficilis TaxID=2991838 RepID=UPI0024BA33E9|nr:YSIRK-type signal peptide-containing protein [Limosilactobacillus difficilis]
MVSKNNIQHKMEDDAKRVPHYGLRKLGIGVASVLLGTTLYFGNAQAVRADATNNAGTSETETEKQTTTPNMSNGTKVTLSDNSKVTNASNETSESNNGNTDETSESNNGNTGQSDITTTKSNNESTQNSIGKVQENGQKSENSITQTIDTDNVNNASQAVPYSKLFVINPTGTKVTKVTNDNSISTITDKSTDRRYSLTFKSYGVMGQNGSTVPDSAFINGKITFPLLLHGNVQNGDTVVITIPYADTYTVNAPSLSSQYGTRSIISGSNTSNWIIKYSFSRSATLNLEIDIEGSNNGYGAKNHPLSDPAGDTKKTIKWFENGTEQDNTGLNFISRQMPSWNPNQQLKSSSLIDSKQLLNSNVVYSYSVREDNGTVPSQAGKPNWPSAQINNTLNYGTTITIPMPEGFVLDVNATNKLVPGFYGDNKQAEIKQEGNNIIITVPSGKGAQGFELKPGYQFVGHYDIKNPETTSFTRTATDRISIVENLTADGKQQKKFTSDKPFSENFWGTSDKVPITNVSTWVNSAWKSKTWNSNGQGELIQWQDDHDQIIAYAGLQNGYSANLNNAQITLNIPDGMIVHGVRVPSISGATSYTYQYKLDDGTVHRGTVMPGDKIEVNDLSRTITSITLTPDVIDSYSGTGTFDGSSNYFNEDNAVSNEMPQMFEIYGHVGKTKRDGKTIVKNGEVWQLGVQLSAVSNGSWYPFHSSENILVLVPSQRQSSSLSSFVNDDGSKSVTIDSNKIDSTQTNLVIRTYYDSSKLSLMASTTAHIDNAILYIKLPKGITYKGLDSYSYAAVKNAKLSVFQDDEDNTIVKIDYTGSYLDITKTINMLLGFSSDVMQGTYKVKTILYSPVEDLMPWTKYFPQNNGKTYSPTSDEQKWLPSDTSNLYLIDNGPATITVTRAISGLNTISLAKGNKDLADNSSNGTSSTTGNESMHFAVSINNGSTNAISNAQTIINLPSKSNGSGFNFQLHGANSVTYSGSTPLTFKYSTSSFNFTNREDTEGYQPNTSSFVTADKVTDWSSIKSILVEIPSLPASSIIGRINIDGTDSTIGTDDGKTGYLGTGLYMAGYKPYVELQSAKIDVLAKKTVTYQFIDDNGNRSKVGEPVQVTGDVDSEQPVNGLTLPTGYKLTKGGTLPTSVKIGNDNQTIDIHLSHVMTNVDHTKPVAPGMKTVTGKVIDGAHEADLNKTITRTINITDPNNGKSTKTQTVKLYRDASYDEVTGDVTYGQWSTGRWNEFDDVPAIAGYTPSQASVASASVDSTTPDATVNISYTANDQTTHVKYKDASGNVIKTDTVTGKTDQTVDSKSSLPAGWKIADSSTVKAVPATITFKGASTPDTVITVDHAHRTIQPTDPIKPDEKTPDGKTTIDGGHASDLNKTVTRTINITNPTTKKTTTTTQTATLTRTGDLDEVTGHVTYGQWSTGRWNEFDDVPAIDDYTPNQSKVSAHKVTADDIDTTINITYTQNTHSTTINYVDENGKIVKTDKVSGHTGDKININVPSGYHIDGGNVPSWVIDRNQPVRTVYVVTNKHDTDNPEVVTKPVLNIIKYVDENGNVVKTETVTGKLGDQITLTIPAGYHFKDGETPNLVITESGVQIVNVVKDRQVTPGNPTINDHDKKNGNNSAVDNNGASQDNNGKKVSTSSTGQSNNANNHKQSQLPQTGNESRNGFSAAGLALASLTSLIGLAGFKKKRD